MGWDIVPLCLGHKLDTSNYRALAEQFSKHFNADVDCYRAFPLEEERDEEFIETVKRTGSIRKISILDYSLRTDTIKHFDVKINSSPYSLTDGDVDTDELCICPQMADLYLCHCKLSWSGLTDPFYSGDKEYIKEYIMPYRKKLLKYCTFLGSRELVYFSDQGPGEFLMDKELTCESAEEFREYIREKRFRKEPKLDECWKDVTNSASIDIPAFIAGKIPVVPNDMDLDILYDDFRDIT